VNLRRKGGIQGEKCESNIGMYGAKEHSYEEVKRQSKRRGEIVEGGREKLLKAKNWGKETVW